jgi:hypothetical protein
MHRLLSGLRYAEPALTERLLSSTGVSTPRLIAVVTRKTVEALVRSILGKLDLPPDANENRRVRAVLAFLRDGGAARVSNPAVEERGHG